MLLNKSLTIFALVSALVVSYSCVAAVELGNNKPDPTPKCSYRADPDSPCSAVCGTGVITKTNRCVCPYGFNGKPDCKGNPIETSTVSCDAGPCCTWGNFTNWTNCTNGYQTRNQTCLCKTSAPAGSSCSGVPLVQTQPCCSWGPWSNWSDCTVNCGGGIQTRSRSCVCGNWDLDDDENGDDDDKKHKDDDDKKHKDDDDKKHKDDDDKKHKDDDDDKKKHKRSYQSKDDNDKKHKDDDDKKHKDDDDKKHKDDDDRQISYPPIPNYCNGSAIETRPCNNFSCCSWGNYSDWSNCTNISCGGYRSRYAICNCTYPYNISSNVLTCPPSQLNQTLNSTAKGINLFCAGPQPNQTQPCANCTFPPATNCTWDHFSAWTQCNQSCNGTQYRRQLCSCPSYNNTCPQIYSDSHCVGIPRTETRPCNISCCNWTFIDNWSQCYLDNNCCGNGTQWRRPVCQCGNVISDNSNCLYAGVPPINQTRTCTGLSCCQLGPLNLLSCSDIGINDQNGYPDFCVTPWSESACYCPAANGTLVQSNYTQCLLNNYTPPPISYNFSRDACGDPSTYPLPLITCTEFTNNSTCVAWNISFVTVNGVTQIQQIYDPILTAFSNCNYNTKNCWDGWTEWSTCCGSCTNATQWRRQLTSTGYSTCRVPPAYETRPCNLTTPCCVWNYNNSVQWSNCSAVCGAGVQHRFPYNCSCGNSSLCPIPPSLEVRNCTRTCCSFAGADESSLCDPNNCSLTYRWNTQKCVCPSNANTSSGFVGTALGCGISLCPGVPAQNTSVCPGCIAAPPNNSTPPVCEWRIISISNCTGNCSRIVVYNTTKSPSRHRGDDDDKKHKDDDDKKHKDDDDKKHKDDDDKKHGDNSDKKHKRYVHSKDDDDKKHKDDDDKKHKDDDDKKHHDDDDDKSRSSSSIIQNVTIIASNGTQLITRGCFCGNRQVAPENCSPNFTVFTTQPCSLNCSCAWQNVTSWSNCTCGKRFYVRKCNCSEILCGNQSPAPVPRADDNDKHGDDDDKKHKDDDDKKHKDDDDKKHKDDDDDKKKGEKGEKKHKRYTHSKDDDDKKHKDDDDKKHKDDDDKKHKDDDDKKHHDDDQCSLPKATYSYTCGGYDIVFEDCPGTHKDDDDKKHKDDDDKKHKDDDDKKHKDDDDKKHKDDDDKKHKDKELIEETATHAKSTDLSHTNATSKLPLLVISAITIVIIITAAIVMILFKNRKF